MGDEGIEGMPFHDRFLIIDGKELYLVGASLKDLGRSALDLLRWMQARSPE